MMLIYVDEGISLISRRPQTKVSEGVKMYCSRAAVEDVFHLHGRLLFQMAFNMH